MGVAWSGAAEPRRSIVGRSVSKTTVVLVGRRPRGHEDGAPAPPAVPARRSRALDLVEVNSAKRLGARGSMFARDTA